MSITRVVQDACERIEAACDEIEEAFRSLSGAQQGDYTFPRSGVDCIIGEARRQAEWTEDESPGDAAPAPDDA